MVEDASFPWQRVSVNPHHAQEYAAWDLGIVPVWYEVNTGGCPEKLPRKVLNCIPRSQKCYHRYEERRCT